MPRLFLVPLVLLAGLCSTRREAVPAATSEPSGPVAEDRPVEAPPFEVAPPQVPSPIEEHDDYVLDQRALSVKEMVAYVENDGVVYLARTTDGGQTWTRTNVGLTSSSSTWRF